MRVSLPAQFALRFPVLAAALLVAVRAPVGASALEEPAPARAVVWVAAGSAALGSGASWPSALGAELAPWREDLRVLDRSRRAETLEALVARLAAEREPLRGGLVVVEAGLADAARLALRGHVAPRTSPEAFERALDALVLTTRAAGAELVLVTPPPLAWTPELRRRFMHGPLDPGVEWGLDELLAPYVARVVAAARRHALPLVDLHWHVRQSRRERGLAPEAWTSGAGRLTENGALGAASLVALSVLDTTGAPAPLESGLPWVDLADEPPIEIDRRPPEALVAASLAPIELEDDAAAPRPADHFSGALLACYALVGPGETRAIQVERSLDGGKTWSRRLPTPANWLGARGGATLFAWREGAHPGLLLAVRADGPAFAFSGAEGRTWTPLRPFAPALGPFRRLAPPTALEGRAEPRPGGELIAFGHGELAADGALRPFSARSLDGGASWIDVAALVHGAAPALVDPALVRSPDGARRALVLGTQPPGAAWLIVEGEPEHWSEPRVLPGALAGEGHVAHALGDGRLALCFRDLAEGSPTHGDWMLWIGTFDDLLAGRAGELRARLAREHEPRAAPRGGLALLADGTTVLVRAGCWSSGEPPFVIARRIAPGELEARLALER